MQDENKFRSEFAYQPEITRIEDAQESLEMFRRNLENGWIPGPEFHLQLPDGRMVSYLSENQTENALYDSDEWDTSNWKIIGFSGSSRLPVSDRRFLVLHDKNSTESPYTHWTEINTFAGSQGFAAPQELITLNILRQEAARLGQSIIWKIVDGNGSEKERLQREYDRDPSPDNFRDLRAKEKEHAAWLSLYCNRLGMTKSDEPAEDGSDVYTVTILPQPDIGDLNTVSEVHLERLTDRFDYHISDFSRIEGDIEDFKKRKSLEYQEKLSS